MNSLFFDLVNDGHHFFYNYNVMKGKSCDNKYYFTGNSIDVEKEDMLNNIEVKVVKTKALKSNNKILRMIDQFKVLFKLKKYINKLNINKAILLYLDQIIIPIYILQLAVPIKCEIIGTLHWFPNKNLKIKFLKTLSDKGLKIIVHTDDLKKRLAKVGIEDVEIIYYPTLETSDIDKVEAKNKLNLSLDEKYKTILYFGETRVDKGLDILLEALENVGSSVNVIIAGQERTFKRDFIEMKISNLLNKNVIINLNYIRDEELELYFKSSDIVVLPYRKMFNGESGILTEAINNKNVVVLPNIIHFPSIIEKYSNGIIYEAENANDLAEKIQYVIDNINLYENGVKEAFKDYKEKHSLSNFTKSYEDIILNGKCENL